MDKRPNTTDLSHHIIIEEHYISSLHKKIASHHFKRTLHLIITEEHCIMSLEKNITSHHYRRKLHLIISKEHSISSLQKNMHHVIRKEHPIS